MWLFMVVFWSVVLGLAYYAISGRSRHLRTGSGEDAGDILDARLARGDITAAEYQASQRTLLAGKHQAGQA
jgi:uncharacterized membrane protein